MLLEETMTHSAGGSQDRTTHGRGGAALWLCRPGQGFLHPVPPAPLTHHSDDRRGVCLPQWPEEETFVGLSLPVAPGNCSHYLQGKKNRGSLSQLRCLVATWPDPGSTENHPAPVSPFTESRGKM